MCLCIYVIIIIINIIPIIIAFFYQTTAVYKLNTHSTINRKHLGYTEDDETVRPGRIIVTVFSPFYVLVFLLHAVRWHTPSTIDFDENREYFQKRAQRWCKNNM